MVWKNYVIQKSYIIWKYFFSRKILAELVFGVLLGSLLACMLGVKTPGKPISHLNAGSNHRNSDLQAITNSTLANQMYHEVKILCFVMTNPTNHKKKAIHVLRTWGRRCNKILFMSTGKDKDLDTIVLPVTEGRDFLWSKIRASFKYIHDYHLNEYDWFLKADDDTYVIVENLRFMLYPYATDAPLFFGCRFKPFTEQGFMSGGAGYVLSRESLRRFIAVVLNPDKCPQEDTWTEDVQIAKCLNNVNVHFGDSRDPAGRARFFALTPEHHLIQDRTWTPWYWDYIFYASDEGPDGCSEHVVSFHYITPNQMYLLDYLIYQLQPYGIIQNSQPLPNKNRSDASSPQWKRKMYIKI